MSVLALSRDHPSIFKAPVLRSVDTQIFCAALFHALHGLHLLQRPVLLVRRGYRCGERGEASGDGRRLQGLRRRSSKRMVHATRSSRTPSFRPAATAARGHGRALRVPQQGWPRLPDPCVLSRERPRLSPLQTHGEHPVPAHLRARLSRSLRARPSTAASSARATGRRCMTACAENSNTISVRDWSKNWMP